MTTSNSSSSPVRTFSPVMIEGMGFVNLTPHPIVHRDKNGHETTIPPSGVVARIKTEQIPAWDTGGPFGTQLFTVSVPGVPEGVYEFAEWAAGHFASGGDQVMGIVSSMFLDNIAIAPPQYEGYKRGLCSPQTDWSCVRNEAGHVIAVRSFRVIKDADYWFQSPGMGGYG
jgi:hypothetical protein